MKEITTMSNALQLTSQARQYLRGLAHSIKPVVQVGKDGITPGVKSAIDRGLLDHELIKIRMYEPEDKKSVAAALADACGACLCGLVGHTIILYRPHPEEPRIKLPAF